nr:MAG TPA: hypothetical protein [Bacteriophage sp.]
MIENIVLFFENFYFYANILHHILSEFLIQVNINLPRSQILENG